MSGRGDAHRPPLVRRRPNNYNGLRYIRGDLPGYQQALVMGPQRSTIRRRFRRRPRRFRGRKFARRSRLVGPSSLMRRLPTSFYAALNAGAGTLSCNILKLNSCLDPLGDVSASIQPMGMDQYESLYQRYCVVGWQISIEFVSTDNTNPIVVGFTPTRFSASLTSQHRYMELPGTVWKVVTPDLDKVVLTARGSVKRWLLPTGGKLLTDSTCSALYNADPSEILYGHVWVQCQDSTSDPAVVQYTAKMTQLIVFFDPISPARSAQ